MNIDQNEMSDTFKLLWYLHVKPKGFRVRTSQATIPLIEHARRNRPFFVWLMLRYESDADQTDFSSFQDTALTWASYNGHLETVKVLVPYSNINYQTKLSGNSSLVWAFRRQNYEVFEYILSRGCNPYLSNYSSKTIHREVESSSFLDRYRYSRLLDEHFMYTEEFLISLFQSVPFEKYMIPYILDFLK